MTFVSVELYAGQSAPLVDNDQIVNHRILDDGRIVLLVLRGVPRNKPEEQPDEGGGDIAV